MIKKITLLLILLTMSTINAQITFDWDTAATDNGDNITETISGITTTFTGTSTAGIVNGGGGGGSSGNVVASSSDGSETTTSVSFNFSEAVDVTSILALAQSDFELTFTPTGGSNSPVVISLVGGVASVTLNWTGVTSFIVSLSSPNSFAFDNLIVTSSTLSSDNFAFDSIRIFPNPVTDFLNLKSIKNLKSSKIYNNLGQLIAESNENEIDLRSLNKGLYLIKINLNDNKSISKRIVKN